MRKDLVFNAHDVSGHLGRSKTFNRVNARYYWPGMRTDINKYVASCRQCQLRNNPNTKSYGEMKSIVTTHPFYTVAIDHVGPYATSAGNRKYVLTIIDLFTKFAIAVPTRSTGATETAKALLRDVIFTYAAIPLRILTDQGGAFCSQITWQKPHGAARHSPRDNIWVPSPV